MPSYGKLGKLATSALAARGGGGPFASWGGQHGSNTLSPMGTPQFPHMPHFLPNSPMPHGYPWGTATSNNTNYYEPNNWPNTGMTRHYKWTITKESCAPDGTNVTCLLINGQFPGPAIEANWGDWFNIEVTNNIPDEGTSIHWHGILQKQTPWMDGVPGDDQCPIAPGSTFTYSFRADLYGTSWYHGHYGSQYGNGLVGPIVIYGPQNVPYDADLGPVMIQDWYHEYWFQAVQGLVEPPGEAHPPLAANTLINGKPSVGAPMASFNVTSGKTYRIRVINPSSACVLKFSIDNHDLTVMANDFVEIQPYTTDHITLSVGQRSDVLVKFNGNGNSNSTSSNSTTSGNSTSGGNSVWMRAYRPPHCCPSMGNEEAKAAIFIDGADQSVQPTTSPGAGAYDTYCGNDPLEQTIPYYPMSVGDPSVTEILPIEFKSNGSALLWYMANRTFRVDYNDPILLESKLGNLNFPEIESVHNYGTNASVRFIVENTGGQPHPMHLHGHNIFILAEGTCDGSQNMTVFGNENGTSQAGNMTHYKRDQEQKRAAGQYGSCWDGTITRASNPQRRDVQMLLPGQYLVVQWNQDNPGTWPFHCHIAWHLSSGFVWYVLENPDSIESEMQIPSIMSQTCRDWAAWTGDHVVDQIDDGI